MYRLLSITKSIEIKKKITLEPPDGGDNKYIKEVNAVWI